MSDDDDPLLQKADALMQRHRAYGVSAGDDVPLLTDVVAGEEPPATPSAADAAALAAAEEARIEALVRERIARMLPLLRRQVAAELDAWFDDQLPQIVISMLDGFTDRLVGQISARARGDVMTFLQAAGEDLDVAKD